MAAFCATYKDTHTCAIQPSVRLVNVNFEIVLSHIRCSVEFVDVVVVVGICIWHLSNVVKLRFANVSP